MKSKLGFESLAGYFAGLKKTSRLVAAVAIIAFAGLGASSCAKDQPSAATPAQPAEMQTPPPSLLAPLRILFVGNSLTGYNNLPGLFRTLAQQNGQSPFVETFIKFGQTLAVHLADASLRNELQTKKWDYVVLQEYSNIPLVDFNLFSKDIAEFKGLVGTSGTKIVLFENWPYTTSPAGTIDALDHAYETVAHDNGASIVYLGRAMNDAVQNTHIVMYAKDDIKHPSPIASYMYALMFLKFFYGVNPIGVTHVATTTNTVDVYSGVATTPPPVDLDTLYAPGDVDALQATAGEVCSCAVVRAGH